MTQRITRDPQKESLWRQRLADRAASGLTIAAWCRQNEIPGSAFHFWKRTIARRGAGHSRTKPATAARPKAPALFAPIVLAPAPEPVRPDPLPAHGAIEIVLAGWRVVRVGAGFDEPTLARVLALLEGGPC